MTLELLMLSFVSYPKSELSHSKSKLMFLQRLQSVFLIDYKSLNKTTFIYIYLTNDYEYENVFIWIKNLAMTQHS